MSGIFDAGSSSLDPGISLIEASAGTGKTFAIAGMVVRLVAERGFGINRILVVTFTEAATSELRDRVRDRIRDAIVLLEEGRSDGDPALANFNGADSGKTVAAIRNLKKALLFFDEAPIFTIHGFCQRMLRENAFETGALFDVELKTDAEHVWRETAEDFWRKRFYNADPETGSLLTALGSKLSPDEFLALLRKLSRHPELQVIAGDETISPDECDEQLRKTLARLRQEWVASRDDVTDLIRNTDALSKNQKDGFPPAVREILLEQASALEETPLPPDAWHALFRLSARNLEAKTLKKKTAPSHSFFDICAELEELAGLFVRLVRREFIENSGGLLAEAKRRQNIVTFDDLLTRLYSALRGESGGDLASAIGKRFDAALIDEFQDTDPVQWEIFKRVFGSGRHLLFLIGDPKQAIYGFRGADIFTYMEARAEARSRFTLGTNWRSDKRLVQAANMLFSQRDDIFVFPEISFLSVTAAEKEGPPELDPGESGVAPQPLQLICVDSEDGGCLTVVEAKERILEMLRGEINSLLIGGMTLNGRGLEPGDIAVLVRTNREAESVRESLSFAGIPAVVRTDRSVLQTEEAVHLMRLSIAILEPHRTAAVKGALATPLFGYDAEKIHQIDNDEARWLELTEEFHGWQEKWNRDGFMAMFRTLMAGKRVNERLLGLPDGERMVTNYQHIAECLHSAEYGGKLTPGGLLRWLREQTERSDGGSDSFMIRLEKDEMAVQIVTIHRSKGLEYPIVFCPFNWTRGSGGNHQPELIFHDIENGNHLTWDLREEPDERHKEAFKREQLAEAIRLLYVAVTRARSRCYLFWAVTNKSDKPENSALAHIFGCGTEGGPATANLAFGALDGGEHSALYVPPDYSKHGSYRLERPRADGLAARAFDRAALPQAPLITSFSGLVSRAHEEAPDWDAITESGAGVTASTDSSDQSSPSIFSFPKGAKAGNFFHKILETLDFSKPDSLGKIVSDQLRLFRFDESFESVVTAKLRELLELELAAGVRLAATEAGDRLVEAPFYYPIKPVSPAQLATLFKRENVPCGFSRGIGSLRFYPVEGYMTGLIDLVLRAGGRYYVIDWKSNWLGSSVSEYRGEMLEKAMAGNFYFLQYHLYTLALHCHLNRTLPGYSYERDFGGVFYVFLRGVDASSPGSGIYHDRPSFELVEQLRATLIAEREVEVGR